MIKIMDDPQGYILQKQSLVNRLAQKFSKSFPNKRDDIFGVAFLQLCQAVKNIPRDHPNPDGYIIKSIIGSIKTFLIQDLTIYIPKSSDSKITITSFLDVESFCTNHESDSLILKDLIKCLNLNITELNVLELLLQGYKQNEIAKERKVTEQRICAIVSSIRKKYKYCWFLRKEELLKPKMEKTSTYYWYATATQKIPVTHQKALELQKAGERVSPNPTGGLLNKKYLKKYDFHTIKYDRKGKVISVDEVKNKEQENET